jgi:hypothetical protein
MSKMALFTIILLASSAIYSQNQHSFFPHHVGDLWEYVEYEFGGLPISTFQATITSDSVDSSGNTHVYFINYTIWSKSNRIQAWPSSEFIIDSLNNVYHLEEGGRPYFLIYKLDAQQGDQWVMHTYEPGQYEMARCDSVIMQYIFGEWRQTKDFSYYLAFDTTETTGLMRYYSSLAEGLGMIYNGGTYDAGYELRPKGAVIDGILYGETTYVSICNEKNQESTSETKISFQVKERNEVNLTIFDINGKQIKNIFKGELEAGLHTYRFEATDISSGIYIYQLKSGNNILQKKCILIK